MHHEGRTRPAILALLLLAMLVATNTCLAARLRCLKCGKTIQGRYLTVGRKAYCGDSCYRKTLPKCAVCRKRISGKYVKHKARSYCSEKCVQKALPKCELCKKALREYAKIGGHVYCQTHAVGPRCDACRLPLLEGKELPDKRVLCDQCVGKIVLDAREAQSIYERAKREVAALTGLAIKPLPPMELTGREKMPARKRGVAVENVQERGFYQREEQVDTFKDAQGKVLRTERKVKENVYILYGLTPDEFLCTAGHELTHALQARFLPKVHEKAPLWLKEGVCQYVAAAIARKHRYADELRSIGNSPHPAYGRGYRYLVERFGENNWKGLSAWLHTVDPAKLPRELPEEL